MTSPAAIVTPLTPSAGIRMEAPGSAPLGAGVSCLTSGLAAGDEQAFRTFHALYFDRLFRYLVVMARGDDDAAREALQETFIRVVRHARRFDDEAAFWSWLTVLARSAATDLARKRHRYWRLISSYAAAWIARPADDESEERLHMILEHGLAALHAEDRRLIEGKYLRGASVRELASESGLTEKAVESRLARARRELREHLFRALKK